MTTLDLYRDIHKAIRVELFAVTTSAARIDPSDPVAGAALAEHVRDLSSFLTEHAEHEDIHIQPVLERELPELAARVAVDHPALEAEIEDLRSRSMRRPDVAELALDLAAFTSRYLAHQDLEERLIMPSLEATVGLEAVVGIHQAILGSIPPPEMARSLALMLPAMNLDGRTELLGGMRAGAPAEVFQGVWSLAASVLEPTDLTAVARRLDMAEAA
jgi:hypothetical protein